VVVFCFSTMPLLLVVVVVVETAGAGAAGTVSTTGAVVGSTVL
jgi:hypothetical protein